MNTYLNLLNLNSLANLGTISSAPERGILSRAASWANNNIVRPIAGDSIANKNEALGLNLSNIKNSGFGTIAQFIPGVNTVLNAGSIINNLSTGNTSNAGISIVKSALPSLARTAVKVAGTALDFGKSAYSRLFSNKA